MPSAMFQRLRLGSSKDKTLQQSRRDSTLSTTLSRQTSPPRPASLLGLPPELRNLVFEFLAADTKLIFALGKKRPKKPPVVGLLLANKQTYREFYPVLLASARISATVSHFEFREVPAVLDKRTQEELRCLAVNSRIYLTQVITHTPRKEEFDNLADWLTFRALGASKSNAATDKPTSEELDANSLCYRYDAKLDPPRSMANAQNMKLALLINLIRQLARLTGPEYGGEDNKAERHRMMLDLTEYKDQMTGTKRTLAEREAEVGSSAAKKESPFFGVQYVPQYR